MAYSDSMKLNMSSPEEIGKAIQKRRRAQKITQKEFAQRLGKSERTIQKYESGEILMKIDVVKQIANELNVPWQELYHQKTPMFLIIILHLNILPVNLIQCQMLSMLCLP